jgi:hypothetical protein
METTGMSWFPGYAIDVETGTRLNMAFGENSWLNGSNGNDMKWNPTAEEKNELTEDPIIGGGHFIYVFGKDAGGSNMPGYDNGKYLYDLLSDQTSANFLNAWRSCIWVMEPLLKQDEELLSTDARVQMRVKHPYQQAVFTGINNGLPAYRFSTKGISSQTGVTDRSIAALEQIKIVPNPYYAYSDYEINGIDTRVKITNLPQDCDITIFNMSGGLVKKISKANSDTFIDWDLKNYRGVPIASGLYIFHVDVPGVGEKIVKWYGAMRLIDVSTF